MEHRRTWLCPDAGDRERLLDMDRRLRRGRTIAVALGGEEFVVLVPGATMSSAQDLSERLREAIAAEPVEGIPVTCSVGVAVGNGAGLDMKAVTAAADAALYRAKAAGRNQVRTTEDAGLATLT